LGQIALQRKDQAGALHYIKEVLEFSESKAVRAGDISPRVYSIVYEALLTVGDPRAGIVLERACHQLQAEVDRLSSEATKLSFIQNVPYRRQLMAAWQKPKSNL
jgi:hypothetical protein